MNLLESSLMAQDMDVLRGLARGGMRLACKYCKKTSCKISPWQSGAPWTAMIHPPDDPPGRVVMSVCEQRAAVDETIALIRKSPRAFGDLLRTGLDAHYYTEEVRREFLEKCTAAGLTLNLPRPAKAKEEKQPELSAVEVAERILEVIGTSPKSAERLCELAAIEYNDKVVDVLRVLKKRGTVASIMHGAKWRLKES